MTIDNEGINDEYADVTCHFKDKTYAKQNAECYSLPYAQCDKHICQYNNI